jgi:hypothetical protein
VTNALRRWRALWARLAQAAERGSNIDNMDKNAMPGRLGPLRAPRQSSLRRELGHSSENKNTIMFPLP